MTIRSYLEDVRAVPPRPGIASLCYAYEVQGFAAITATPIALARCVFTQQRLLDP
jgi:hypothetical protein